MIATVPGSPAAQVLQPFDVIHGVVGGSTPSASNQNGPGVFDEVAAHHAGDTVELSITRDGQPRVVSVTLGSLADSGAVDARFPTPGFLGVQVQSMTPALAIQDNLPAVSGVLVGQVFSGGGAAQSGLVAGDIITSLDGIKVASTDDLTAVEATVTPNTPVRLTYLNAEGLQQSTNVTLGIAPAQDAPEVLMS